MTIYLDDNPTCEWQPEDDDFNPTGPKCGKPATFLACDPIGQPVCEEHKCRCKIPIYQRDTLAELVEDIAATRELSSVVGDPLTMPVPDRLTIGCSCHRLDHAVRFSYDADDDMLSVEMTFEHGRGFWQRVATAWRYVFGGLCAFGPVADVLVKEEDREKLRAWVNAARKP